MGEHGTWTDFLANIPAWQHLSSALQERLGRADGPFLMLFDKSHWSLTHSLWSIFVLCIILYGCAKFYKGYTSKDGIIPPKGVNARNFFETIADSVFDMMVQVMGEKAAKRFLPLIGSLALFIFFSNIMALIPGFGVPTTTLKTNLVLAFIVFFATHFYGFQEHGIGYVKQFWGPVWWLGPLLLPIELISHIARPISLALRLMGNMAADHKVVFTFFALVPLLVPIPFLFLGTLVCIVQTLVFCLLSMVYISMAISHDH